MRNLGLGDLGFLGAVGGGGERDPFFSNVALLLHGNGANGSTTITDSSPSPKTVTAFSNAQISTAQSKFGGASLSFAATTDYLSLAPNQDYVFGTGDFTVEFWLYLIGNQSSRGVLGNRLTTGLDTYWQILFYTTQNRLEWHTGKTIVLTAGSALTTSAWNHIAFARQGSTFRLFINGDLSGSVADSFNYSANNSLVINRDPNIYASNAGTTSFMDDIRVTKGVARYTSNFTPPIAPFPDI